MEISRRDLLKCSVAGGSATALGSLLAVGANLEPVLAQAQELRIAKAKVTPSVCPFCSVGCATLVHTIDGQIVNIEGDSRSPHNEGTLCPKGAATFQLHINPNRPTQVLHRAAGATDWEVWDLNRAMDRVAELVKKTRDETFREKLPSGKVVNATTSIFSLGGATLDIEWNQIQQKLMRGLGIVAIENQARI
jgi:formate dehydrogenase major subunit